jgi:PadR family transcriptional regulator AphA
MSLRHGLLGLLARDGPRTGYELTRAFDRSVNWVWHAVHGQIYPELAMLAKAGLIRQTATGPRGAKRFEVTDAGLAELRHWITDIEPKRGTRNETLLRVFFANFVEPGEIVAFLEREATVYRARLAALEAFADKPATTPSERASALTVEQGLRTLRAWIEWAEWAADEVRSWDAQGSAEA